MSHHEDDEEFQEEKNLSCKEKVAFLIIDPNSKKKVLWDIFMGFVYLICFLIDPVIYSFNFEPLFRDSTNRLQRVMTFLIVIDMIIMPFEATVKEDNKHTKIDDEEMPTTFDDESDEDSKAIEEDDDRTPGRQLTKGRKLTAKEKLREFNNKLKERKAREFQERQNREIAMMKLRKGIQLGLDHPLL